MNIGPNNTISNKDYAGRSVERARQTYLFRVFGNDLNKMKSKFENEKERRCKRLAWVDHQVSVFGL